MLAIVVTFVVFQDKSNVEFPATCFLMEVINPALIDEPGVSRTNEASLIIRCI